MAKKKSKNQKKKGFNLGLLLELGGVVLGSTRTRKENEAGIGNFALDYRKLGLGLATLGGQKSFQLIANKNKIGQLRKALKTGLITPEQFEKGDLPKQARKKNQGGRNFLLGSMAGATLYVLALPAEQREQLFKQLDSLLKQAITLADEIQGKPYSQNFEPEAKA